MLSPVPALAAQEGTEEGVPYYFSADRVAYDEDYKVIVAVGGVEIHTDGEILKADTVTIYEAEERIEAEGNVSLTDPEGNTYFTDKISLTDNGNKVFAQGVKGLMKDNARITGTSGYRNKGEGTVFKKATYSPCEGCKTDPDAPLPWQLKASQVIHDEESKTVIYRNAKLEMWDVPVFWTPYFSHPDPSVKQRSGFLRPSYGYKTDLGTMIGGAYYWGLAPDQDITTRLVATTQQGALGDLEYRKRFESGELYLRGSLTQSDRIALTNGGMEVLKKDRTRGHIEGKLNYNIDDKWRAGFDIFKTSDDQYADLYDYNDATVYENRVFAERFDNRDFTSVEFLYFQDTRLFSNADQPAVLPWVVHDMYGDPNNFPVLGGRWRLRSSMLALTRDGNGQDMSRMMVDGNWNKEYISDMGLKTNLTASSNLAWFYTSDRVAAALNPALDSTSSATRFYPQIHGVTSYPMVQYNDDNRFVIEPLLSMTSGINLDENDPDFPNEDSNDLLLDWTNLFEGNRFPGYDRLEDGTRMTYGLNTGIFKDSGTLFNVFLGQSHRITSDNIFPKNAGLEADGSDYVGGFQYNYLHNIFFDYGVQVDDETFDPRRHEFSGRFLYNNFTAGVNYFYDESVAGTGLDQKREQIEPQFVYMPDDEWRLGASFLYDLSSDQDGLIRAKANVEYILDCMIINTGIRRNLIDRASGESELEFLVGISFENLGTFGN